MGLWLVAVSMFEGSLTYIGELAKLLNVSVVSAARQRPEPQKMKNMDGFAPWGAKSMHAY